MLEDLAAAEDRATELYRAPGPDADAYVENNYWHLRNHEAQVAALIDANRFWWDFAHGAGRPAVFLDEPRGGDGQLRGDDVRAVGSRSAVRSRRITRLRPSPIRRQTDAGPAKSPLLAGSQGNRARAAATSPRAQSPILVSQNYYRLDEPYRFEGNERFDAFITGEFLADVAYGCRVVVTNPSSSTPRELDLLLQIPRRRQFR